MHSNTLEVTFLEHEFIADPDMDWHCVETFGRTFHRNSSESGTW